MTIKCCFKNFLNNYADKHDAEVVILLVIFLSSYKSYFPSFGLILSPLTLTDRNNLNDYQSYHDFLFPCSSICCICHCFIGIKYR